MTIEPQTTGAKPEPSQPDVHQLPLGRDLIMILGWIATITAVLMYVSYISQIQLNLAGHKGSVIQPFATAVNCSLWVLYGLLKPVRDWPVALANAPGVLLGAITFATAL